MSVVEILTSVMRQNRSMCQLQLSRKFAGSVSHLMTTPVRSDTDLTKGGGISRSWRSVSRMWRILTNVAEAVVSVPPETIVYGAIKCGGMKGCRNRLSERCVPL